MIRARRSMLAGCLWWLFASWVHTLADGRNFSQPYKELPACQPGFYCPQGNFSTVPCPKGTYGPTIGAVSIDSCLKCPPQHYCPRPGLFAPLPCGPVAQQPLSGQDTCTCSGEGQIFQTSDGRCHCTIGYEVTSNGDLCVQQLYSVCRDGKSRTQYGDCFDKYQWSLHCRREVCQTEEDYRGYDRQLGLCVCRETSGRAACSGLCRGKPAAELKLHCHSDGDMELVWSYNAKVLGVSGSVLEMIFKQWDSQGNLQCNSHLSSSRPVYIVQTTEAGFFGLLSGLPEELQRLFPDSTQWDSQSSADGDYDSSLEVTSLGQISHREGEIDSGKWKEDESDIVEKVKLSKVSGVLNPTTCLHQGDILLFTVDTHHYPQYDMKNLYNTNRDFDWGVFRLLKEEMTLSWAPPSFFSVVFSQPGVYVFTLSSHPHKHMYVRVMPAGGQCYESGPFFPALPRHVTRMGISRRRDLLLRPDWLVTGGLLFGAVVILCLCVTLLVSVHKLPQDAKNTFTILIREYGWPEKETIKRQYRLRQLAYKMDDYASKGSRVISLRKTHRKQKAGMAQDFVEPAYAGISEEFWDYEQQVDLEAFNSNTFYTILLKQSLAVTTRLGQLTTEVKELYQGVLGKLKLLHPRMIPEERVGDGYERIRREMEREVARRKTLASQMRTLLESQLQLLKSEQQAKLRVYSTFMSQLRECTRILSKVCSPQPSFETQHQIVTEKLMSVMEDMGELLSAECHRQGAWGLLGEGTGAKLLCPDSGTVLTKDDIFSPDGSLCLSRVVHCDSVTGLVHPNAHSHMLLSSGHSMAVPPDFFVHPQTGRVMPIAGNVAFDPTSSTLVPTTDLCSGDNRKWDSPLLPFIPYPTICHSEQPLPKMRLKGLRLGQRLQLGAAMTDPDTGVPVPILAVTIHPQTGLVYPLGRLHVCPLTRLPQPIQIGYPILDSRTGNIVLTVGVSLDPVTGDVLPVGGVLLAESFIEPLSGRMMKVGGASLRAGHPVPNAGGYQILLDSKVLAAMLKVLDLLKSLTEECGSDPTFQHLQPNSNNENAINQQDHLLAGTKDLEDAWGRSLHCQLQLQTRLEMLLDWAVGVQQDGGTLGEMPLPGSDTCVPALLGMDYPDPMGSGLVPIRYGSQTLDPVTGLLAPVVGARLDVSKKTIVAVTASYWLMMAEQSESLQVEALQSEICVRNSYWQQQKQREEDILTDLDSAVFQCLFRATNTNSYQIQWSARQLREASVELQDAAQAEAQRRAAQRSYLAMILPSHVLHILTLGDEEEWDQQCIWQSTLMSGFDKVNVCMDQLEDDKESWTTQTEEWCSKLHATEKELRQREFWEQCCSAQTELDAALSALHFVRVLSQLRADTAQAVLCWNFWFKEYGLVQHRGQGLNKKVMGVLQQRALPLLEKLNHLLEEKQPASSFPSTCTQHTKQAYGLEIPSRVWTASVPVVKGISTQSLREPVNITQSQGTGLQDSVALTHNLQRHTASSGIHSHESQQMKESVQCTHIAVPTIAEEQWARLLELSPLFQLLKGLELQLKGWAKRTCLIRGDFPESDKGFIDILDAQWGCEGELTPLDLSVLNPREFLVYQHGLFLMRTLHDLNLEAEETLFVRRQRLQSVGGFSLMLLHCLSHIKVKNMSSDSSPAFQRIFFKVQITLSIWMDVHIRGVSLVIFTNSNSVFNGKLSVYVVFIKILLNFVSQALQECLGELFYARLVLPPSNEDADLHVNFYEQEAFLGDRNEALLGSHAASLLHRLHKPSKRLLSEDKHEIEQLQQRHRETSLFSQLEGLLKEKSSAIAEKGEDQMG
ncbi:unnamed protein product [Menidia menidia]|uniref:(Atlantic silverside) hypothetical protein n=1 Tax=Menidia menidia TaxID=238744 RepID=A0A8S4BS89_9TELE|nr:unnamed protein product [Menidia menidia]